MLKNYLLIITNKITSKVTTLFSNFFSTNRFYPHIMIYKYYFFASLGLILFSSYIYINFLRPRVPKEIPFNLTEVWFYVLIFICIMYLFSIKQILKPKIPPIFLVKVIQTISYPFSVLDYYMKNNKIFRPYYQKLLKKIITVILKWWEWDHVFLIIFFDLLPKIILVLIFFVDVFFVGKIEIFYYFILLGLIPFGFRYFQYSLYYAREEYIRYLENLYGPVCVFDKYSEYKPIEKRHPKAIYHDKLVSIREYLKIQEENSMITYPADFEVEYYCYPLAQEEVSKNYRIKNNKINVELTTEDYDIIDKPFNDLIGILIEFNSFLETHKVIPIYYKRIPYTKIFIYFVYFICWTYILLRSYDKVISWPITLKVLEILIKYIPLADPFSLTLL